MPKTTQEDVKKIDRELQASLGTAQMEASEPGMPEHPMIAHKYVVRGRKAAEANSPGQIG